MQKALTANEPPPLRIFKNRSDVTISAKRHGADGSSSDISFLADAHAIGREVREVERLAREARERAREAREREERDRQESNERSGAASAMGYIVFAAGKDALPALLTEVCTPTPPGTEVCFDEAALQGQTYHVLHEHARLRQDREFLKHYADKASQAADRKSVV